MATDGFTSAAESRRLEAEANEILKQDAIKQGSNTGDRRSFTAYAKKYGLATTTHTKVEKVGFTNEQLEHLHALRMDNVVQAQDDREEDN